MLPRHASAAPVDYHPYLVGSKIPVENAVTKAPWSAADYMALTGSVGGRPAVHRPLGDR
jgi:hypothetical protein